MGSFVRRMLSLLEESSLFLFLLYNLSYYDENCYDLIKVLKCFNKSIIILNVVIFFKNFIRKF